MTPHKAAFSCLLSSCVRWARVGDRVGMDCLYIGVLRRIAVDGLVVAGDWAEGFLDAMGLRPEAWTEMLEDEKEGVPLVPILALSGSENESPVLAGESEELEALRTDATQERAAHRLQPLHTLGP